MKKVAFITLGCKVNQYETNAMTQKFIKSGYEIVNEQEKADIYIINTCTVTNMSDRKSRQMLRRVRDLNKKAIIVACGCYAQVAKSELEKIEEIDLILGNNEKGHIVKNRVPGDDPGIRGCKKEFEVFKAYPGTSPDSLAEIQLFESDGNSEHRNVVVDQHIQKSR